MGTIRDIQHSELKIMLRTLYDAGISKPDCKIKSHYFNDTAIVCLVGEANTICGHTKYRYIMDEYMHCFMAIDNPAGSIIVKRLVDFYKTIYGKTPVSIYTERWESEPFGCVDVKIVSFVSDNWKDQEKEIVKRTMERAKRGEIKLEFIKIKGSWLSEDEQEGV